MEYKSTENSVTEQIPHIAPLDLQSFSVSFAIAAQVHASWMQATLGKYDLTAAQLSTLSHLSRLPDEARAQRISDIASAMDANQPAVTKMMAKFENLGWVKFVADSADKRAKRVRITERGHEHLITIQRKLGPPIASWFADWEADNLRSFTAHLQRLTQAITKSG